jgi:hypothetical protein
MHVTAASRSPYLALSFAALIAFLAAGASACNGGQTASGSGSQPDAKARYAALRKGVPAYAAPGRGGKPIDSLAAGEKCELLETRDVPYKEISETWANVRRGDTQGWVLSYYLAASPGAPPTEDGDVSDLTAGWTTVDGTGVTLGPGGSCTIEYPADSQEQQRIMADATCCRRLIGYSWTIKGGQVIVEAEYSSLGDDGANPGPDDAYGKKETEAVMNFRVGASGRFFLDILGDGAQGPLFRTAAIHTAVFVGDRHALYCLLENSPYAPDDFNHFPFTPEGGSAAHLEEPTVMPLLALALAQDPPDLPTGAAGSAP